ncbi:hypothetical protein HELRODRAFT_170394 [Helobdella robusta]|uniref:Uncharacterized protein n=1 Tax=Helobdella robusta TaxID=6412 RepID=T1F301_HELRO|nr:hypothetical protein HELRODRAFT_170394 [Helobdella robusta]ESO07095.1 hypothetical protein HELRODRAFT_170394 [Helobdella robusta]
MAKINFSLMKVINIYFAGIQKSDGLNGSCDIRLFDIKFVKVESSSVDGESSSGGFMVTLVIFIVLSVLIYILYHNRKKVIGYIVEGRRKETGRRRKTDVQYQQLSTSADDVLQKSSANAGTSKEYIY